ncbi:MAG: hypothetical protein ACPKPY_12280 [Nitrososphaeraceae archaeon]
MVQTLHSFLNNLIDFNKFIIAIVVESSFVIVIIKVYDEIGCKWENIKTIPIQRKEKKEIPTTVHNNYYYSKQLDKKMKFCGNCGNEVVINYANKEQNIISTYPKFCKSCGYQLK